MTRPLHQTAEKTNETIALAPVGIDPTTGWFSSGYIVRLVSHFRFLCGLTPARQTWGGGGDSYFEYLIKHARLSNTDDAVYIDTWLTAIDSSIKHLLRVSASFSLAEKLVEDMWSKTSVVGNHTHLADYDADGRIRHTSSHLACFHGGNFLYGEKKGSLSHSELLTLCPGRREASRQPDHH